MFTERANYRLSPTVLAKLNGTTRMGELKRIKRGAYGKPIRDGRRWFVSLAGIEDYRGAPVSDSQLAAVNEKV
jgi:hypothetical protein